MTYKEQPTTSDRVWRFSATRNFPQWKIVFPLKLLSTLSFVCEHLLVLYDCSPLIMYNLILCRREKRETGQKSLQNVFLEPSYMYNYDFIILARIRIDSSLCEIHLKLTASIHLLDLVEAVLYLHGSFVYFMYLLNEIKPIRYEHHHPSHKTHFNVYCASSEMQQIRNLTRFYI